MAAETDRLLRGIEYLQRNLFLPALVEFDAVLAQTPDNFYAHWNKATALLSLGDYERGFVEHDYGWQLWNFTGPPVGVDKARLQRLPRWRGEAGCKVLVYHELGFGDAIMMLRYLPELARRASVTVVALAPLLRLMQLVAPGVAVVERVPADLSGYDFRLPLFGAMLALKQTLADIPHDHYVGVDWHLAGGKMGIAWTGRTQRSFLLTDFLARLAHKGHELFNLTTEYAVVPDVQPLPPGDFVDLAERIACMDHVVTVDTAAAHLAGAMGHPSVHLVLPYLMDWRWWQVRAWYPAIKTYRQEVPGDWGAVFDQLNEVLKGSPTASGRSCPARAADRASRAGSGTGW